jgi:hypothetical protein
VTKKPAASTVHPPKDTLRRLYALPQLMPTTAQLYDCYIDALDSDRLADADLCLTALHIRIDARFALLRAKGKG